MTPAGDACDQAPTPDDRNHVGINYPPRFCGLARTALTVTRNNRSRPARGFLSKSGERRSLSNRPSGPPNLRDTWRDVIAADARHWVMKDQRTSFREAIIRWLS